MEEYKTDETKPSKCNSHLREALNECIDEGKKVANDLYNCGLEKMNLNEDDVEKYRTELITKIQANPLKSVLIAGSIGFILAKILKK